MIAARIALGVLGIASVVIVIDAAVRTFVLPRGATVTVTRMIARALRSVFDLFTRPAKSYEQRDRVMALYAPLTLLAFPIVWLGSVFVGFIGIFWAVEHTTWSEAVRLSGSALFTLGFDTPRRVGPMLISFVEAAIGLGLLALLISYLPTIYGSFSRREVAVGQLTVRAGTPPSPSEMIIRAHRTGFAERLDPIWQQWELWFVEIEETHTSVGILSFFRSPNPHRSWITAAGAILDTAALRLALLDIPWTPDAATCIRAGYLALRAIADNFQIPYDAAPNADDPISVTKSEFFEVYDHIAEAGVPVKQDREQAWRDFAGWRVNYDTVLLTLAGLVMAPYAPWSSDRSPTRVHRPPIVRRRSGRSR
ncbi:MAG TPA: hypothetical protein VH914_09590 [Acidimicrobiia bacterium]|nr:hypothetical protein [Acidimicrobiia bacterium]